MGPSETAHLPQRRDDLLARTGIRLALVATVWIILLMILIVCDILARNLLNSPIRGVPEIARESVVAIVFLALPFSLQNDRWIKSEMLIAPLARRAPRLAAGLGALFNALSCGLMTLIAVESVRLLMIAWRIGDYVGAQGIFTFPVWPVKTIILLGSSLTALEFARRTLVAAREARRSGADA